MMFTLDVKVPVELGCVTITAEVTAHEKGLDEGITVTGSPSAISVSVVEGSNAGDDPRGDDKIDLSELLTGEVTDITDYLTLEQRDEGTVLLVNSEGKLRNEGHDQEILLKDISMADLGSPTSGDIITQLIDQGKLIGKDGP